MLPTSEEAVTPDYMKALHIGQIQQYTQSYIAARASSLCANNE